MSQDIRPEKFRKPEKDSNNAKPKREPIHLVRTVDHFNRKCYFFLMCSHLKIRTLKAALSNPTVDLNRYGKVLTSGIGHQPSKLALDYLKETFDFDLESLS